MNEECHYSEDEYIRLVFIVINLINILVLFFSFHQANF